MNKSLQEHARKELKFGLVQLSEKNHLLFKRMYSPNDLKADINVVVDMIPEDRLDWAMQQVQRSLDMRASS